MDISHIARNALLAMKNLESCAPDESIGSISNIDLVRLYGDGYRYLLIDWDGTIAPFHTYAISKSVENKLKEMRNMGYNVCIHSNCSEAAKSRMEDALNAAGLDIHVQRAFPEKKPLPSAYHAALETLETNFGEAKKVAAVGDRILIDILGANVAGFHTIFVMDNLGNEPLSIIIGKMLDKAILYVGNSMNGKSHQYEAQ